MAAKRIAWLDFAKGVTIFLVVIVHVVEGVYKTGQFPAQQNISTNIMGVLFTVVMPVFLRYLAMFIHRRKMADNILSVSGKNS